MAHSTRGLIFDIQGYSIHDGPGIRTTVFLKGCSLRCVWCQNPESHSPLPELLFAADRCEGCGRCVPACPERAIHMQGSVSITDRRLCKGAGACARECPNDARAVIGRWTTADEVFQQVAADSIFYQDSGGGVTLSGGEPLAQPEFSTDILRRCKEAGFHTALDTCGHAPWPVLEQVLRYVDLVLYDFKHVDATEHRRLTGVSHDLILENARRIHRELSIPLVARIALVPGLNDSPENLDGTARFIAEELSLAVPVHLLPYHRLGEGKWERMGRAGERAVITAPGDTHAAGCVKRFEAHGLRAVIGG